MQLNLMKSKRLNSVSISCIKTLNPLHVEFRIFVCVCVCVCVFGFVQEGVWLNKSLTHLNLYIPLQHSKSFKSESCPRVEQETMNLNFGKGTETPVFNENVCFFVRFVRTMATFWCNNIILIYKQTTKDT